MGHNEVFREEKDFFSDPSGSFYSCTSPVLMLFYL
jgi:hypothetical protein